MKIIFPFIGLILVGLDQYTKYLAKTVFVTPYEIWDYWLELRFAENPGVAFSMPVPSSFVVLLTAVVVGWLLYYFCTKKLFTMEQWAIIFILSGAIGNVIDRIFNDGKVIDFISVGPWPIFNIADSCITVGVGLYIWNEVRKKGLGTRE